MSDILNYFTPDTITLRTWGDEQSAAALVYGMWGLCVDASDDSLGVTHIPSGRRITRVPDLTTGARMIALLNGLAVDWAAIDADRTSSNGLLQEQGYQDAYAKVCVARQYWRKVAA